MKFVNLLFSALFLLGCINCAAEDHSLKPQDYMACEEGQKAKLIDEKTGIWGFTGEKWKDPESGDDCNKRWNSGIMWYGADTAAFADYSCCYVEYEETSYNKVHKCYLVLDTKNGRSKYKERALDRFSHVKIKCASSYLKLGSLILLLALFF